MGVGYTPDYTPPPINRQILPDSLHHPRFVYYNESARLHVFKYPFSGPAETPQSEICRDLDLSQ